MLIAIHPIVAMHFCSGNLHSHNLYTSIDNNHCCHTSSEELLQHTYNFKALDIASPIYCDSHEQMETEAFSCCDFQVVEIPTKEYQAQSQENLDIQPIIAELNDWFQQLNTDLSDFLQEQKRNDFPPEGLFFQDINLLSYICILRI